MKTAPSEPDQARITRIQAILVSIAITTLALTGCVSVRHDNAARLLAREDFAAARAAAPEWCRDALKTINTLEYELERK
jgi:uncharacterized protein YceK